MIVITGHIRVAPDQMDALRPAMRAVLEATRKESGCLLYAYGEDVLELGNEDMMESHAHGSLPTPAFGSVEDDEDEAAPTP